LALFAFAISTASHAALPDMYDENTVQHGVYITQAGDWKHYDGPAVGKVWDEIYRSYFVYDLASVPAGATAVSGTLTLPVWSYYSGDPMSVELATYPGDLAWLGVDSLDAFSALGSGTLLQSADLSGFPNEISITLGEDALNYLTAALTSPGLIVFGLRAENEGSLLQALNLYSPFNLTFNYTLLPLDDAPVSGGSGASAASVAAANRQQVAHRQMQAQQAAARRVAAQQKAAQHRRNQQR